MHEAIDLVALRRPVSITLPCEKTVPVAPYRGHGIALLRQYRKETDPLLRGAQLAELIKLALPTATEEDLDDTGPEDWARIVAAAAGKAELMEIALGNVLSVGDVPESPTSSSDSATTTSSPASVPA
jgi:hypothetical protein